MIKFIKNLLGVSELKHEPQKRNNELTNDEIFKRIEDNYVKEEKNIKKMKKKLKKGESLQVSGDSQGNLVYEIIEDLPDNWSTTDNPSVSVIKRKKRK